jgi:hypothetical protein
MKMGPVTSKQSSTPVAELLIGSNEEAGSNEDSIQGVASQLGNVNISNHGTDPDVDSGVELISATTKLKPEDINSVDESVSSSQPSDASRPARMNHVGIKHFATNRIIMRQHKSFYEKEPCLLIIPIMTNEEVTNWDGRGYSAIVLAQNTEHPCAAQGYRDIGATGTDLSKSDFVTSIELEIARELLERTILVLQDYVALIDMTFLLKMIRMTI